MRSQLILLTSTLGISLMLSSTASAAPLLASDSFDYADGNLAGQNGGTGFSTAWGDANGNTASANAVVSGGVLTTSNVGTTGGTIYRGLSTPLGTTGTVWMQFDYSTTATATGFSGLQLFNGTSEQFLIGGRSTGGTSNAFWEMSNSGAKFTSTVDASTLQTGVVSLDIGTGIVELWVGVVGSTIDISGTADLTATGVNVVGVDTIRFGSRFSQNIDNFEYAANASDLTAVAVPEPSTYAALLGLSVLVLAMTRRRRIA